MASGSPRRNAVFAAQRTASIWKAAVGVLIGDLAGGDGSGSSWGRPGCEPTRRPLGMRLIDRAGTRLLPG
jgi:hypothetical protein